jgi:transcriptional regulator with XRE-family HTH domain
LGWTQEKIAGAVGIDQSVVSRIVQNTIFGKINNLLSQGRDMDYIIDYYHIDIPLAWALRLEGKKRS